MTKYAVTLTLHTEDHDDATSIAGELVSGSVTSDHDYASVSIVKLDDEDTDQ